MESFEPYWTNISEAICPEMPIFGKYAFCSVRMSRKIAIFHKFNFYEVTLQDSMREIYCSRTCEMQRFDFPIKRQLPILWIPLGHLRDTLGTECYRPC